VQGWPYHKINQPLRKPQDMVNPTTTRPEEPVSDPHCWGIKTVDRLRSSMSLYAAP